MAVYINTLIGGDITVGSGGSPAPATRATTIITTQQDGTQELLVEGDTYGDITQWLVTNGFRTDYNPTWLKNITAIDIGTGSQEHPLTQIGGQAFQHCTTLTNVTMSNSIRGIGSLAFNGCTALQTVTIGGNISWIMEDIFGNCPNITSVTFQEMTMQEVQDVDDGYDMTMYPFGLPSGCVIHCSDGNITVS